MLKLIIAGLLVPVSFYFVVISGMAPRYIMYFSLA